MSIENNKNSNTVDLNEKLKEAKTEEKAEEYAEQTKLEVMKILEEMRHSIDQLEEIINIDELDKFDSRVAAAAKDYYNNRDVK